MSDPTRNVGTLHLDPKKIKALTPNARLTLKADDHKIDQAGNLTIDIKALGDKIAQASPGRVNPGDLAAIKVGVVIEW